MLFCQYTQYGVIFLLFYLKGGSESTVPIDKLDCKLLNMSESVQMENRNSDSQSNIDQQGTSQLEDSQDTDDSETPQASASPREPAGTCTLGKDHVLIIKYCLLRLFELQFQY